MIRPLTDDDVEGGVDGSDVVDVLDDAVFKQLESEEGSTMVKPPEEGDKPFPTTLISNLDPAGKSGVQRNQVFMIPVSR